MYSVDKYKNLISKYGAFSSWAIWDYKSAADTKIVDQNFNQLHSKFVLLGLNISGPLRKAPWSNFHDNTHARKLKYACNDTFLRGSYITDLFKGIPESKSKQFERSITNEEISKNVAFFNQEMRDIEMNNDTQIIILGSLTSKYFNKYFKQAYTNNCIYYDHYSAYNKYTDKEWVNGLWTKLDINQNFDLTFKKYR